MKTENNISEMANETVKTKDNNREMASETVKNWEQY